VFLSKQISQLFRIFHVSFGGKDEMVRNMFNSSCVCTKRRYIRLHSVYITTI